MSPQRLAILRFYKAAHATQLAQKKDEQGDEEILHVICEAGTNAGGHVYRGEGQYILAALRAAGFSIAKAHAP